MTSYLIDSSILTCVVRKRSDRDRNAARRVIGALRRGDDVLISPVAFYEVARGLFHKGASSRLAFLDELVSQLGWIDFDRATWSEAAKLWGKCRSQGTPTGVGLDGDVLIAAQARQHSAVVVTGNRRHFEHLGVRFEDWLS